MKKLIRKPFLCAGFLLILYILIAFLGAFAVISYPVYYEQRNFLTSTAENIAAEYATGSTETLDYMAGSDIRILVLDENGNYLRHILPNYASPDTDPGHLYQKRLPTVLSGKNIFTMTFQYNTNRNRIDITVIAGVPVLNQNSTVGSVFMIKTLKNLPDALLGYLLYFTIFYWLAACLFISYMRKVNTLEQLQRNYIANITHALKTPITSIKALSETLCDGVEPDPDQQRVYYGMILREANRQDHMIRDVLQLSKMQSNGMDFTKTKLDAFQALEPLLDKYGTLADCMGISLHISDKLHQLPLLYTNEVCLKQMTGILLDNALKFVPEGGDIWIDSSIARNHITFCVRDNGVGIPKDALPHVFERFFKGSHDFNASGSGLGLAIAKETAAGLKEKIWVESKPDKGSAFYFTVHLK